MLTSVPTISPTVSHFEMIKPSNDRPDPKAALKFLAWATESVPTSAYVKPVSILFVLRGKRKAI